MLYEYWLYSHLYILNSDKYYIDNYWKKNDLKSRKKL